MKLFFTKKILAVCYQASRTEIVADCVIFFCFVVVVVVARVCVCVTCVPPFIIFLNILSPPLSLSLFLLTPPHNQSHTHAHIIFSRDEETTIYVVELNRSDKIQKIQIFKKGERMSEKLDRKHLRYMSEKFREISEAQMFQVLSKEKPEVGCCFFL